jgi:transcriptional regulator with XRE-family HTH domain
VNHETGAAIVPHPVDTHAGRQLRARRTLLGYPQKEVARQLEISFQQVQRYESGANRISARKMWQLSQVLDVVPGYFFEGLESKKRGKGSEASLGISQDGRSARQVLDLNTAFKKIDDTRVRRQIVQLVKSLARS